MKGSRKKNSKSKAGLMNKGFTNKIKSTISRCRLGLNHNNKTYITRRRSCDSNYVLSYKLDK
jgi:hypothetical protein